MKNEKRNKTHMLKKAAVALMLMLALSSVAPVAHADVDMPECLPCDPPK
jgi:hypothetical protein